MQEHAIADLVEQAIATGEGDAVEFKAEFPEHASSLAAEIAAFSACEGGVVLIGVDDDASVVGFADERERVDGVLQMVEPRPSARVHVYEHAEGTVCVIEISKGLNPPYLVNGRAYVRDGSISRPARSDEISNMVLAARGGLDGRIEESIEQLQNTTVAIAGGEETLDHVLLQHGGRLANGVTNLELPTLVLSELTILGIVRVETTSPSGGGGPEPTIPNPPQHRWYLEKHGGAVLRELRRRHAVP